jgi:hypothetical protein
MPELLDQPGVCLRANSSQRFAHPLAMRKAHACDGEKMDMAPKEPGTTSV